MRVVLDSNVLVSAFALPQSATARVVTLWEEKQFTLIISEYIVDEVTRILVDKFKLPRDFVELRISALYGVAEVMEPVLVSFVGVDKQDLPILGTAVGGRADFLVTGDKKLLGLGRFDNAAIVTPRDFLDLLH